MSLPASLLTAAEAHPCFSGCYSRETVVSLAVDPSAPTVPSYDVSCEDCLTFRIGALQSLLPPNYTSYQLATDLAAHVRSVRGYAWSVGGYHGNVNGGVWLSAASFGNGLLLVDAGRNRGGAGDLDVLIDAFKARLVAPEDPGMIDPQLYAAEVVYVELSSPFGVVRTKQDILASRQCSRTPQPGYHRVTLLEFLPMLQTTTASTVAPTPAPAPAPTPAFRLTPPGRMTTTATPPPAPAPVASPTATTTAAPVDASPRRKLALGERCPVCNSVYMRRQLLTDYFEGCMC